MIGILGKTNYYNVVIVYFNNNGFHWCTCDISCLCRTIILLLMEKVL